MLSFDTPADAAQNDVVQTELQRYCKAHPRSPVAVRKPRVMMRGGRVVVLLGSTLEDGIAGIGSSIEAALQEFDVQYRNALNRSAE